jgi:hypothetical protein
MKYKEAAGRRFLSILQYKQYAWSQNQYDKLIDNQYIIVP